MRVIAIASVCVLMIGTLVWLASSHASNEVIVGVNSTAQVASEAIIFDNPDLPALDAASFDFAYLGQALLSAIKNNAIKVDDLDRIDFTVSEPVQPTNNFHVLNVIPKKFKELFSARFTSEGGYLAREVHEKLALDKGQKIVFNLRRFTKGGIVYDTLYAIVPKFNTKNFVVEPRNSLYHADAKFQIALDNHSVVNEPAGFTPIDRGPWNSIVVYMPDGTVNYFFRIVGRYKKEGEEKWQTY